MASYLQSPKQQQQSLFVPTDVNLYKDLLDDAQKRQDLNTAGLVELSSNLGKLNLHPGDKEVGENLLKEYSDPIEALVSKGDVRHLTQDIAQLTRQYNTDNRFKVLQNNRGLYEEYEKAKMDLKHSGTIWEDEKFLEASSVAIERGFPNFISYANFTAELEKSFKDVAETVRELIGNGEAEIVDGVIVHTKGASSKTIQNIEQIKRRLTAAQEFYSQADSQDPFVKYARAFFKYDSDKLMNYITDIAYAYKKDTDIRGGANENLKKVSGGNGKTQLEPTPETPTISSIAVYNAIEERKNQFGDNPDQAQLLKNDAQSIIGGDFASIAVASVSGAFEALNLNTEDKTLMTRLATAVENFYQNDFSQEGKTVYSFNTEAFKAFMLQVDKKSDQTLAQVLGLTPGMLSSFTESLNQISENEMGKAFEVVNFYEKVNTEIENITNAVINSKGAEVSSLYTPDQVGYIHHKNNNTYPEMSSPEGKRLYENVLTQFTTNNFVPNALSSPNYNAINKSAVVVTVVDRDRNLRNYTKEEFEKLPMDELINLNFVGKSASPEVVEFVKKLQTFRDSFKGSFENLLDFKFSSGNLDNYTPDQKELLKDLVQSFYPNAGEFYASGLGKSSQQMEQELKKSKESFENKSREDMLAKESEIIVPVFRVDASLLTASNIEKYPLMRVQHVLNEMFNPDKENPSVAASTILASNKITLVGGDDDDLGKSFTGPQLSDGKYKAKFLGKNFTGANFIGLDNVGTTVDPITGEINVVGNPVYNNAGKRIGSNKSIAVKMPLNVLEESLRSVADAPDLSTSLPLVDRFTKYGLVNKNNPAIKDIEVSGVLFENSYDNTLRVTPRASVASKKDGSSEYSVQYGFPDTFLNYLATTGGITLEAVQGALGNTWTYSNKNEFAAHLSTLRQFWAKFLLSQPVKE